MVIELDRETEEAGLDTGFGQSLKRGFEFRVSSVCGFPFVIRLMNNKKLRVLSDQLLVAKWDQSLVPRDNFFYSGKPSKGSDEVFNEPTSNGIWSSCC
jgi:hypothetical protein